VVAVVAVQQAAVVAVVKLFVLMLLNATFQTRKTVTQKFKTAHDSNK
jgi:hypothetical protein